MSKDLEKEYRALMDSEAPNLWARIEPGSRKKKNQRDAKGIVSNYGQAWRQHVRVRQYVFLL